MVAILVVYGRIIYSEANITLSTEMRAMILRRRRHRAG